MGKMGIMYLHLVRAASDQGDMSSALILERAPERSKTLSDTIEQLADLGWESFTVEDFLIGLDGTPEEAREKANDLISNLTLDELREYDGKTYG